MSQTPAPFRERLFGSRINQRGSASRKRNTIQFGESLKKSIANKIVKHNRENPNRKITIPTAFAVVRRGMGAYSTSHRPFISMGRPNSRTAWGLARLNKFIQKKLGKPVKKSYIQDNDLL